MKDIFLEASHVRYDTSAVKTLRFEFQPHSKCFRLHWHDRMELLRIKNGKIYVERGTELVSALAGDLVIIPPKVLHKGYTLDESVEYEVLMFDVRSFYNEAEISKKLLPAIFEGDAVLEAVTSNSEIIRCIDSIYASDDRGTLETISKIYHLLFLFCRNELLELRVRPNNIIVKKMINYLEENATQDINLVTLCEAFGYTSGHLCRKFKKATGLPPMTYLKIYRLELAYNKLKNRDASISDIAAECGFSDANYFTRCFKLHFGFPPIKLSKTQSDFK